MSLPVRLIGEASEELSEASAWYEERRSGLGLTFFTEVARTFDSLATWPATGTLIDDVRVDLAARRLQIGRFPYYAAYIVRADHVLVVAVAHERQRPHYWSGRVSR